MTRYMLSVYTDGNPGQTMSEEQQRDGWARVAGLEAELETAQALVFSARMGDPTETRVVRRGPGRPKSTDGPYVETKEQLGGFYVIEAPDLDTAMEWANRVSEAIGQPIEVRPFAGTRAPN